MKDIFHELGQGDEPVKNKDKRIPLMKQYNIPIENLDFAYVEKCNSVREIEKIYEILQSGEEGIYPELLAATKNRLIQLNPRSHLVRETKPALKTEYLDPSTRSEVFDDLKEWVKSIDRKQDPNDSSIFCEQEFKSDVPIRGNTSAIKSTPESNASGSNGNTNRIKSWEYDKWDKFNVDEEITRMEVKEKQVEEWERHGKKKIIEEQKTIEKLMKNEDVIKTCVGKCSRDGNARIVEVQQPSSSNSAKKLESKPQRRFKIKIEDVNIG